MNCRFCGTPHNLVHEAFQDEDGFVSHDPVDLCHECVEHAEDRRRARAEWKHYHPDEPVPEGELPLPGPRT